MLVELRTAGGNSILQDYPWGKYERHIDIAGAYGSFIAELLKANPKSTGVLFDQPQVGVARPSGMAHLACLTRTAGPVTSTSLDITLLRAALLSVIAKTGTG